jgi:hypothetical protein
MAIRIVCGGNSVAEIMPSFDERVIESVENSEQVSFIMDVKDGKPVYKRLRNDADVSDYIAELNNNEEISRIEMDEKNRDIIIYLRELGEEPIEIGEIPTSCPEVIVI